MNYDFDKIIDRRGTSSLKYDFAAERGRREDILPLWVADMDFQTAPGIIESLTKCAAHGIYGYSDPKPPYFEAVLSWMERRFGWSAEAEWIVPTPGVVFALAMAVRAFTAEGDGVLIQRPVYYPFTEVVEDNHRRLVNSPLVWQNGRYEIDFADLEEKLSDEKVKLMLFCSPHNPVGRVWSIDELRRVGELCIKHHVLLVSDEIHADFVYEGHTHHPMAAVSEAIRDHTILCTAPSKSFNLAGLQISNIFIADRELRARFKREIAAAGYSQMNQFGLAACEAAYRTGEEWLDALKSYLSGNLDYMREFLSERLPELSLIEPEGTYLIWVDFRRLGLTDHELKILVEDKAGLWLDRGSMFGPEGAGFERFNIACPRATLERALTQLEQALHGCAQGNTDEI